MVQLQCGSCSKLMAIRREHLGAQVQCPHCRAIVQAPPASAFGQRPENKGPAAPTGDEPTESIFAEAAPSDDVFGQPAVGPRVVMPEEPRPSSTPSEPLSSAPKSQGPTSSVEEVADLVGVRARVAAERQSSHLSTVLLIFLVPYALLSTGFIAYLLYNWPSIDRLDYLPDPRREGGRRAEGVLYLPPFDSPLAANRKVGLAETVRVGDIEITPIKVVRLGNDLQLQFRARNISEHLRMTPIEPEFFNPGRKKGSTSTKHFTFLEGKGRQERAYGGDVEYSQKDTGELRPGAAEEIRLTTEQMDRDKVLALINAGGPFLWRLQVRRGLISYRGAEVPATAVVGVHFTVRDIVRDES